MELLTRRNLCRVEHLTRTSTDGHGLKTDFKLGGIRYRLLGGEPKPSDMARRYQSVFPKMLRNNLGFRIVQLFCLDQKTEPKIILQDNVFYNTSSYAGDIGLQAWLVTPTYCNASPFYRFKGHSTDNIFWVYDRSSKGRKVVIPSLEACLLKFKQNNNGIS